MNSTNTRKFTIVHTETSEDRNESIYRNSMSAQKVQDEILFRNEKVKKCMFEIKLSTELVLVGLATNFYKSIAKMACYLGTISMCMRTHRNF